MPTLMDAIGAETPVQCDGRSLIPFLEGTPQRNWRTEAHWEFDFRDPADDSAERALGLTMHQCAMNIIRDHRYKYVHFTRLPPLFFDLASDPEEFVNRAEDPACLPLVLEYAQKLLSWRMNHDEQLLTHIALTDQGPNRAPRARDTEDSLLVNFGASSSGMAIAPLSSQPGMDLSASEKDTPTKALNWIR